MKSIRYGAAVMATSLLLGVNMSPAFAMGDWPESTPTTGGSGTVSKVPEIDAVSGMAALAAVSASLAFAWERRRGRDQS